ncbi:DUF1963 domain-containing protein [Hymenobacter sp. J193]|uniref:YwqG family protein n=1 Tax=Hymenobacter sp. J193 TaxID=2898429 RepID=UPI002150757B|nr:YwqG family protein [Hymenobacter sp. J193]MCR5890008.1 DUF1963 domain-containing protein [Hymenobacter sp. J193]
MDVTSGLSTQLHAKLQGLLQTKQQLLIEPAERPTASQLLSHIGGDPYFELGETWPVNPETGQPLELIFQLINPDGTMPWPFEAQVVQFYHNYYSGELPYDDSEPHDYRIKLYPRARPEQMLQLPRPAALPPIAFSYLCTQAVPSLPDDDELDMISPSTEALCRQLRPDDWRKAYNEAVTALAGEPDLGSWVGGYAQWLQSASPTGEFWLQFDSTNEFSWGDSGLLYFFADFDDPTQISFQLQSC